MALSQRDCIRANNTDAENTEMAKLQKKFKQQQRRNSQQRSSVTKLTPAEVRSLTLGVTVAKEANAYPPSRVEQSGSNTPPQSPETTLQHHPQDVADTNLPTPPQSPQTPTEQRRDFNSTNGHVQIHAPKPQPNIMSPLVNKGPSRPSSAASYRGISTYRGPEITRTGSLTMFCQPQADIVSNPLSQFSRPRRSTTGNSPERSESRNSVVSSLEHNASGLLHQAGHANNSSRHTTSPSKTSETMNSVVAPQEVSAILTTQEPKSRSSVIETRKDDMPVQSVTEDKAYAENATSKSGWFWRRSMIHQRDEDKDLAALKKGRRRTMSFSTSKPDSAYQSVPYSTTQAGVAPEMKTSLKTELPSVKGGSQLGDQEKTTADAMFESHPGVRPLGEYGPKVESQGSANLSVEDQLTTVDVKGKGRDAGAPVYGRCSCCGKLRKPTGFHSELSPVIENENLRTNFSFEADRASMTNKQRSSSNASSHRQKYIPIIPMPMSADKTVQASIEPAYKVIINETGDVIATSAGPVTTHSNGMRDARMSRFSSLHISEEQARRLKEEKRLSLQSAKSTKDALSSNSVTNNSDSSKATHDDLISVPTRENHPLPEVLAHQANTMVEQEQMDEMSQEDERALLLERGRLLEQLDQDAILNDDIQQNMNGDGPGEVRRLSRAQGDTPKSSNETSPQRRSPVKQSLPAISLLKWRRRSTSEPEPPKSVDGNGLPVNKSTVSLSGNSNVVPTMPRVHNIVTMSHNENASTGVSTEPVTRYSTPVQYVRQINALYQPDSTVSPAANDRSSQSVPPQSSVNGHSTASSTAAQYMVSSPGETLESSTKSYTDRYPRAVQRDLNIPPRQSSSKPRDRNIQQIPGSSGALVDDTLQQQSQVATQPQVAPQSVSDPPTTTLSETQTQPQARPQSQPSSHIFPQHSFYNLIQPQSRPLTSPSESTLASSSSTDYLPALRFGPHFARSNSTLRDFVIPKGRPTSNLVEKVMQASNYIPTTPIDQFDSKDNHPNGFGASLGAGNTKTINGVGHAAIGVEAVKMRQDMRKNRLIEGERKAIERLAEEVMAI